MSDRQHQLLIYLFLVVLTLVRLTNAALLPPIQDEAYYFYWSRFFDLGYFDHPPLVAWLSSWLQVWPSSSLAARAGTLTLSVLAFPLLWHFFKVVGLREKRAQLAALVLGLGNLGGILLGYITTPDIPLIFCWMAALHEAAVALDSQPRRWLSAGFFTGLGIMGKYTMLLIGPVFLLALLRHPRQLREKWPYLGGLVCVLTLLPHLYWQSQNDWITLRFQMGRGLKSEYGVAMQTGTQLPPAETPALDGIETHLANFFKLPADEIKKPKAALPPWRRYLQGASDYLGGQLAFWGFLVVPLLYGIWRQRNASNWPSPSIRWLVWSAALVPLVTFGLLSPVQHVEVNWPAMYLIGAAAVFGQHLRLKLRPLLFAAAGNLGLSLLITFHCFHPLSQKRPHADRLLRETHGYEALAQHLKSLGEPLFVDTYQNLSQLAFYQPQLALQQWPGVARSSELIRRPAMNPMSWQQLQHEHKGFYLLTDNMVPPHIPAAQLQDLYEILDCFEEGLRVTRSETGLTYKRPCAKRVHRWSLAYYALDAH